MHAERSALTGTHGIQAANEPWPGLCVCLTNTCTYKMFCKEVARGQVLAESGGVTSQEQSAIFIRIDLVQCSDAATHEGGSKGMSPTRRAKHTVLHALPATTPQMRALRLQSPQGPTNDGFPDTTR